MAKDRYQVREITQHEVFEPLGDGGEAIHYRGDEATAFQVRDDMEENHNRLLTANEEIARATLQVDEQGSGRDRP